MRAAHHSSFLHWLTAHETIPVWSTGIGTAVLAIAAWKALAALGEAKTDRHVQVMIEIGRRWNSNVLVDAQQREIAYSKEQLAALVATARDETPGFSADKHRRQAEAELAVLLRIPDFYEDLAFMANRVDLDDNWLAYFKGLTVDTWSVWEPAVHALRKDGDPFAYTQFEALAKRMYESVPDL